MALKSDPIVDLLELHDTRVVYEFDRTRENMPDQYWAACGDQGVELLFDERQSLCSIFLHVHPNECFARVDLSGSDIRSFASLDEIAAYSIDRSVPTSRGSAELLGTRRDWIRLEYAGHWEHYEFRAGELSLITLTVVERPQ